MWDRVPEMAPQPGADFKLLVFSCNDDLENMKINLPTLLTYMSLMVLFIPGSPSMEFVLFCLWRYDCRRVFWFPSPVLLEMFPVITIMWILSPAPVAFL